MFVDTHCHLDFHQFDSDRDDVLLRAAEAGVTLIVNPAVDLANSRRVVELAERTAGVYAQVGIHPNDSGGFDQSALAELRELAAHRKVVAIGEIGLDYYWERVPHDQQQAAFQAQLELAAEMDLPAVIHCRDAHADMRDILRKWVPSAQKRRGDHAILGVLHAYSGDLDMAREAFGWNMVLSLGGPITFRNAHELRALVAELPVDKLMLETDAPYLTPHPHRGRRNEPAYITLIAQSLAELVHSNRESVAQKTTALAKRVFNKLP
jgi:TatD DNase family protein